MSKKKKIVTIAVIILFISIVVLALIYFLNANNAKYIGENEAKVIVDNFIKGRSDSDTECKWGEKDINIESPLAMYDENDKINSYAYNFKYTNGDSAGYAVVSASIDTPRISTFSYEGGFVAYGVEETRANNQTVNKRNNRIYKLGLYDFFVKDKKGNFINTETQGVVTKKDIREAKKFKEESKKTSTSSNK